jgi:dUTP pyrophosphatase
MAVFKKLNGYLSKKYYVGDRVAQLIIVPYPTIEFVETETLSETQRGEGGFGSTGQ